MAMCFKIFRRLTAIFLFVLALMVAFSVEYPFRMVKKHKAEIGEVNRKVARGVASRLDALLKQSFAAIDVLSSHPAVNTLESAERDALFARNS